MATSARRGPYICGIDAGMDVVTGKWKSLILWELENHGVRRFAELRRGLVGVSEKMLIQQLREMEEDGLVHREVYREVPPKVEYSLTEHGVSLNAALASLGAWGSERIARIGAERVSHDAAAAWSRGRRGPTEAPAPVAPVEGIAAASAGSGGG
ncbi:helix-turn-helix domain-containing protein [Spongiactinospora sp. TRM90649]|uniref:winged helix-turn-helix transcriptional regulator n=1 Tax=Spongiactinospora sp. TRM90649 TaxID=3031114 RepID=UPI0023F82D1F|nr:helix-turn-helix domain-containing protein [Spongiactinospora sp. TRM90649]MDF5751678.1 helix-turn-helix domain-containing protein [Spongiactinospora sp. TRM90649]